MTRRGASIETMVRTAVRVAVVFPLLALGSSWSSADPHNPLGDGPARAINLLKPPLEDLRIHWSAAVHEAGGEFIISRQGLGGTASEVTRLRTRGDGRYDVEELDAGGGILTTDANSGPQAIRTAALLSIPEAVALSGSRRVEAGAAVKHKP